MSRETLRAAIAVLLVLGVLGLTLAVLEADLPKGAREAGIVLVTLAWNNVGFIIRALFPARDSEKGEV